MKEVTIYASTDAGLVLLSYVATRETYIKDGGKLVATIMGTAELYTSMSNPYSWVIIYW